MIFGEANKRVMDIKIEHSNDNFITWSEKSYLSEELKESVLKSDILIVPVEEFRDLKKPVFPQRTEEIFKFLKDNSPKELHVEVCIKDEDYQEFALYDDSINIGLFVVTAIALPFLINLLSNYVSNKFIEEDRNNRVKISFTVVKNKESKTVVFEGDASKFLSTTEELTNICLQQTNTLNLSEIISKDSKQEIEKTVKKKTKSKRS